MELYSLCLMQLMISDEDLKELGIPMGPRKKLSSFISQCGAQIRAAKVSGGRKGRGVYTAGIL